MSGTGTRTATDTATFVEQVLKVTRPVFTDLLAIADTYSHHLSKEEAWKYVCDFREFMNERYLESIEVSWTDKTTGVVIDGLKYVVVDGEAVRTMDRPGGMAYSKTVAAADFDLRIHYTNLWSSRSAEYKARFKAGLTIPWSAVAALNYGRGSYVADGRQYGATDVGISRLRFKPT